MGFSLKKLVEGVAADVNPFDGGRSHGNMTPQPVQQQRASVPRPASTAQPQQSLSVQPVNKPQLNLAPPVLPQVQPKPLQVKTAAPQVLTAPTGQVINRDPNAMTQGPADHAREEFLAKQNSLATKVKQGLQEKLNLPIAAAQQVKEMGQNFVARPLAEAAATITHPTEQFTYHPNSGIEKFALGNTPVQNIQKKVINNYQTHPDLPGVLRYPLAAAEGVASVAQDAPVVGGLAKGVEAGIKEVAPVAKSATTALVAKTVPLDEAGFARVPGRDPNQGELPLGNVSKTPAEQAAELRNNPQSAGTRTPNASRTQLVPPTEVVPAVGNSGSEVAPVLEQPPVVTPPQPASTAKVKQNRLTKGGKEGRQNIGPGTQELIQGEHNVRNTQRLSDTAQAQVDAVDLQSALTDAHKKAAVPLGNLAEGDQTFIAKTIERTDMEANKALQAGDQKTYDNLREKAAMLHDALSEQGVARGQANQALSILYQLSPQGLYYKAVRDIKKAGGEVTPELEQKLQQLTDNVKGAVDKQAKGRAIAELSQTVAKSTPKSGVDNAISVWKAGLLSGPITHAGNFLSNGTFGVLKKASDIPSTLTDQVLSLATGKRSKTLTLKGAATGTKEGAQSGFDTLKTGIDMRGLEGSKYETHGEINFKNPAIQKIFGNPSNLVFRAMNAGDQPFYFSAFRNGLADLAKAEGLNNGLKGKELRVFVNKMIKEPTDQLAAGAKDIAEKAVLGQDNTVASWISQPTKSKTFNAAKGVLVPFTKVPTNYLARTLDYTPVGAVNKIVRGLAGKAGVGKGVTQRELAEAIGESTTGSAVLFLGANLAANKLLSGQYPTDPKEQEQWKAEGKTPNSVKVGGKWVSLNYLGPAGLILGAGKDFHDAAARGDNGVVAAMAGAGKNLTGQSFLTGFSGFANALNDPGRYGQNLVNQEAGSIVPSWMNTTANALDPNQRETNNPWQAAGARTPLIRNGLPKKQDVYGEDLKQRTEPDSGGFGAVLKARADQALDPFRPSKERLNPVTSEVQRLHNVDENNKDLAVTPTKEDKKINVNGKDIKISDSQRHDLQKAVGTQVKSTWDALIKTPEYQALNDTDKANALNNYRQGAQELARRQYVLDNNLGSFDKPASGKADAVASADLTSYTQAKDPLTDKYGSSNSKASYYKADDAEYKQLQKQFDDNVKYNKFNSVAEKIKAQDAVNKSKVGAGFSKDVRDLHGLSDKQLYNYVSNDPNGQAIVDKVLAYDDALTAAGIQTKDKFKNKYGVVTLGKSANGGSGGRTKKDSATIAKGNEKITSENLKADKALHDLVNKSRIKSTGGKKATVVKVALKRKAVKK